MQQAAAGAVGEALAIEDVFSTYLYTGNGSTQTITNGIDLAGEGGLVWWKRRDGVSNHLLTDSVRGITKHLTSQTSNAEVTNATFYSSFNSDGFTLDTGLTSSGISGVTWTFRKAPRFFDAVTYTGTGSAQTISHNLGCEVGTLIVKRTDSTGNWGVFHRSQGPSKYGLLHDNLAFQTDEPNAWNGVAPTDTVFSVGAANVTNTSGATYVAYLFAHDPLGPSGDGSDGLIACGSYAGNSSADGPEINLGWESQWVMIKSATGVNSPWLMYDTMRGMIAGGVDAKLQANASDAETSTQNFIRPTATGFKIESSDNEINNDNSTYIYIAIRRGPMREPTSGTEVFKPVAYTGNGTNETRVITTGFPVDTAFSLIRNGAGTNKAAWDRLRGNGILLYTSSTSAEVDEGNTGAEFDNNLGLIVGSRIELNYNGFDYVLYSFRRAPGFFDVVAYSGNGGTNTISHNLGVAPELIILKRRNLAGEGWHIGTQFTPSTCLRNYDLNSTAFSSGYAATKFVQQPTDTSFVMGNDAAVGASGGTYIAYLFATLAGVSKVGSYTGNGSSQTINCGFTGGARFVLVKKSSGTGDWLVFDTARGIVSGNDPALNLNTTSAEDSNYDMIDPASSGFAVTTAGYDLNENGSTYIFLAIA